MAEDHPDDRADRFVADFQDLNVSGPTLESILRYLEVYDKPEAQQRAAVGHALAKKDLGLLELDVLRDEGWIA